jgi:hypothetical protein
MIKYVWSFLGFGGSSSERTVVGNRVPVDLKEVAYIRDSNARLSALHHLVSRYKGTPHEPKLKAVFEKTKNIHTYLAGQKRTHELELFHVRHTDHFINTFTVIMDVHQRQKSSTPPPPPETEPIAEAKAEVLLEKFEAERISRTHETKKIAEMVSPMSSQGPFADAVESSTEGPRLSVPDIAINTYSKIIYLREDTMNGLTAREIGFTSTKQEKENFLSCVSARLGINKTGMSYYGNAMVTMPGSNGSSPTGYVPILHWKGYTYALNLNDYRLFPVRLSRKSL